MGIITDVSQNEDIDRLKKRVSVLERNLRSRNGGNEMSAILKDLIGKDCTVTIDYDVIKCRVLDADDVWVKLLVYGKKEDKTVIRRIDDISGFKLD